MGASPIRQAIKSIQNYPLDAFEVLHHVAVRHPHNLKPASFKALGAPCIGCRIGVCIAINFDDQTFLRTKEVCNGAADNCLPAKLIAAQLRAFEHLPQALFRLGRLIAHGAGVGIQLIEARGR